MSNTTEDDTMEEQNELNDLKKLMETQQKTLTETMSAMELKATALQEKLDKKAKLSSANAEAGVKKIAIEYKVVELKIEHELPPGFGEPKATSTPTFGSGSFTDTAHPRKARQGGRGGRGTSPFIFTVPDDKVPDDKAIIKECEEKARQQYREFEETKLKELGEEGWTLRSIAREGTTHIGAGYTNLYYFSRPL